MTLLEAVRLIKMPAEYGMCVEYGGMNGDMTPEQFIALTENAYGSEIIRQLKEMWEEKAGKAKEKNA